MKKLFSLMFFTFFLGCGGVELLPSTADDLILEINKLKSKKVVLLNVWALWCMPCIEEFPMIVKLENEIEDLEIIFVSADFDEEEYNVKAFLNRYKVGPISYIKKEKDEPFIERIHKEWTGSLPFTVVYAKSSGNIVDYWEGIAPESKFRAAINIALNS